MKLSSSLLLFGALGALYSCKESTSPPAPQSLAFSADAAALVADDSLAAAATLTMSDGSVGSPAAITYASLNTAVATVDSRGLIHALAAGTATITAQVGSLRDELVVTVSWAPITKIAFSVEEATILLDDSLTTTLVVTNSHNKPAPNASVTYTSSNPIVATVDATGRVRTFFAGSTTITAREGALSDILEITVAPHFIELAVGGTHSCGITGTRLLYCWGSDLIGNLGAGTSSSDCTQQIGGRCSVYPIPVTGADRFVSVTIGEFHTCALTVTRVAYCWGGNVNGGLGIGTTQAQATTPTPVAGGLSFVSLGAGRLHTCGITIQGDTYCWGWDYWGQLGGGSTATDRCDFFVANSPCSRSPVKVVGSQRFVEVTGAASATCGRTTANTISCWGLMVGGNEGTDCQSGQRTDCTRTPLLQVSGATFMVFGMTGSSRCGHGFNLTIQCWGIDFYNFGNGSGFPSQSTTPIVAGGGRTYEFGRVIFGAAHVCGMNAGVIECWGSSEDGQSGGTIGTNRVTPGPVDAGVVRFSKIVSSPNSFHNCGIATTGRAYCWGFGKLGQLGNGTLNSSAVPVLVKLVR